MEGPALREVRAGPSGSRTDGITRVIRISCRGVFVYCQGAGQPRRYRYRRIAFGRAALSHPCLHGAALFHVYPRQGVGERLFLAGELRSHLGQEPSPVHHLVAEMAGHSEGLHGMVGVHPRRNRPFPVRLSTSATAYRPRVAFLSPCFSFPSFSKNRRVKEGKPRELP